MERLRAAKEEADALDLLASEFPAPPIAGIETIQPLDTPNELINEAGRLFNCALDYWREIISGKRYLYRLLAPERVTILLVREETRWALEELAGMRNRAVSSKSRRVVEEWLARQPPFTENREDQ